MATDTALQNAVHGVPTAEGGPSERELRVATLVRQLYGRALAARRPLISQWKKNYRVLNNKTWGTRGESWIPNPEMAEIWPVVSSMVAWMTDQRPTIEVTPSMQPFTDYADFYQALATDMNSILQASFIENGLDAEIAKALWDVMTYGVGYLKTGWEPWLADGLGDSVFRRRDPFTIYPDPNARNPQELNYIIEARVMTIADLDRSIPGSMKLLGAGGGLDDRDDSPHKLDVDGAQSRTPAPDIAKNLGGIRPIVYAGDGTPGALGAATQSRHSETPSSRATGSLQDSPMVLVMECWIRDYTTKTLDNGTAQVVDNWRCIVVSGNRVLLDHSASDINAFPTHPYDKLVMYDTGEWYGPCLVEFLTPAQESINRILGAIEYNMLLMGNPILVESPRSASQNKRISNRPGQRMEANPHEVQWLQPPQMHPQIAVQLIQFYQSKIESISGLSAIVRGFSPNGRNAQGVMDTVQDAAFVRVRATLRELERCLRGAASKMAATIAEFYTEERFLSMLGPDGDRTTKALRARHFYITEKEGQGKRIPLRFSLLADAGSQLPTSKQARSADAERLFALGAIDHLELLKAKQWPNYAVVAKRMMEQQAAAGMLGQPPGARQRTRA
jgi:hypothetical protein